MLDRMSTVELSPSLPTGRHQAARAGAQLLQPRPVHIDRFPSFVGDCNVRIGFLVDEPFSRLTPVRRRSISKDEPRDSCLSGASPAAGTRSQRLRKKPAPCSANRHGGRPATPCVQANGPRKTSRERVQTSGRRAVQLTAFFTRAPILASSAAVNFVRAKAFGHMFPSSRFARSLKPNVAYRVLNFCAL